MDEFTTEVRWLRGHAMNGEYGRASLQCRMILHGPQGSMEWRWRPGPTPERVPVPGIRGMRNEWMSSPASGSHVGYHFDEPADYQLDDSTDQCDLRPGGRCYYDASYVAADDLLEVFLLEGDAAMWAMLRERYDEHVAGIGAATDMWVI